MHYAVPVEDPRTLLLVSAWALYLWPVVVVGVVAVVKWRRIRSRVSFIALSYLVCLGAQAIARSTGHFIGWVYYIGTVPTDRIVVALVNTSITVTFVAAILGIGPVIWMARLCANPNTKEAP